MTSPPKQGYSGHSRTTERGSSLRWGKAAMGVQEGRALKDKKEVARGGAGGGQSSH